ncbi:DUF397 domain-containing protein [Streptomyces orinoci]|uniref:DUF397 domain-containing protein n=1 Tax=Streptomyces orinoci TaxID=67339 RepID=A0ABV3KB37_STRON|nr:DUF397 domain-containing protein [Streptomyces orinoci]
MSKACIWQKSTFSSSGAECLTVKRDSNGFLQFRESDEPSVTLRVTCAGLKAMLAAIRTCRLEQDQRIFF